MRHSIFISYFFVLVQGQNQEPPCQAPDNNNNWVYTSSSDNPNYAGAPGVWYYLSSQKADIYSFDQYCKSLNSNMAKILTEKENDFLTDLLINSHNAWLAGHMVIQNNTFENWYWFNNADANNDGNEPDSQLIEYFNWDQGQPITKNGKSWITINGDKKEGQTPGKWTARTPDNVNYFLCESRCSDTNNDPEPGTVLFEYGDSKNFTSDSDGIISCRGCDPIGQIDYLPKNYRIEVIGAFLNNDDTQPTLKPSQYFIPLQIGSLYIPNEGVTRNDAKTLPDIYIYKDQIAIYFKHYLGQVGKRSVRTYLSAYYTKDDNYGFAYKDSLGRYVPIRIVIEVRDNYFTTTIENVNYQGVDAEGGRIFLDQVDTTFNQINPDYARCFADQSDLFQTDYARSNAAYPPTNPMDFTEPMVSTEPIDPITPTLGPTSNEKKCYASDAQELIYRTQAHYDQPIYAGDDYLQYNGSPIYKYGTLFYAKISSL